jgi:hypothetical protein
MQMERMVSREQSLRIIYSHALRSETSGYIGADTTAGFYTATVRPTALYGEGDFQMVEPIIRALEDGQTNIWMGDNKISMDVVYVGHGLCHVSQLMRTLMTVDSCQIRD